jgi:hypothetical protein
LRFDIQKEPLHGSRKKFVYLLFETLAPPINTHFWLNNKT